VDCGYSAGVKSYVSVSGPFGFQELEDVTVEGSWPCHPMAPLGTSWHYRTEPSFPNSG
jgi:hypothetical protein